MKNTSNKPIQKEIKQPTNFTPIPNAKDEKNIYVHYFQEYPSEYFFRLNDKEREPIFIKMNEYLLNHFSNPPNFNLDWYTSEYDIENNDIDWINYIKIYVFDNLVITITGIVINFYYNNKIWSEDFLKQIGYNIASNNDLWKKKDHKHNIYFVKKNVDGLSLLELQSRNKEITDLTKNYNDDFVEVDKRVKSYLSNDKNGIILFHSEPGAGKTSYIRYLMNNFTEKQMVYLPPNLANVISDPSFVDFAVNNLNNSVLIIEYAENIIKQRNENQPNQSVSNLLNLADGLMSDVLQLQIICTFNCHIGEIDEALKRKGRMFLQYRFEKLSPEKANVLLKEQQSDFRTTEPMSLAEIYNEEDNNNNQEHKKKVGF